LITLLYSSLLERNLESIFTVDEFTRRIHGKPARFVKDTLGTDRRIDGTLPFPNLCILGRHFGFVETGMENAHRNALAFRFLRQQHGHHVGGRLAHVVAVVATIGALRRSPLDGTTLRSDHDDFAALLEQSAVDEGCRHAQRTNGANVNCFEFILKVQVVELFDFFFEIACVVDELYYGWLLQKQGKVEDEQLATRT